jgi:hypothetical protein
MPYFDDKALRRLRYAAASVSDRATALTEAFLARAYHTEAGKEHAHHGVCRRVAILVRCVNQIFARLPPELEETPARETLLDAAIFIQAFVFNVFGTLDNLAFVWVNERDVRKPDGTKLPNGRIGLTKDKERVRESFSEGMQCYLAGRDAWMANLESFRHSLGHRIPLYIPPYVVSTADLPDYEDLGVRINDALFKRGDLEEHEQLKVERQALASFRPWMKHSFEDPTPPIAFHAQVLADFATIEEMARRILAELDLDANWGQTTL